MKFSNKKFAAVIVVYYPSIDDVEKIIASIANQVDYIYVMKNAASDEVVNFLDSKPVRIIDMHGNQGIARALNAAADQAKKDGVDFLITFDQDSVAVPNHVSGLYQCWLEKEKQGLKVGGVGPSFYDKRSGEKFQYPFYKSEGLSVKKIYPADKDKYVEVDILITSGMLVNVDVILINKFLDDLFIDFVDTEWCFRINRNGYQSFGCFDVSMQHELSEAAPQKILGLTLLKYSPLRRYYFFRNCVYVICKSYTPWAFKMRMGISMVIRLLTLWKIDEKPKNSLKMAVKGIFDAVRGKMGQLNVK